MCQLPIIWPEPGMMRNTAGRQAKWKQQGEVLGGRQRPKWKGQQQENLKETRSLSTFSRRVCQSNEYVQYIHVWGSDWQVISAQRWAFLPGCRWEMRERLDVMCFNTAGSVLKTPAADSHDNYRHGTARWRARTVSLTASYCKTSPVCFFWGSFETTSIN